MKFELNCTQKNNLKQNNLKEIEKHFSSILESAADVLKIRKPDLIKKSQNMILGINLINDDEIQEINKKFRNKDKPTDVLSWGFLEQTINKQELFGEIYISVDTARKQAAEKNHDYLYEMGFLLTHGLLHVFGYDHQNDQEEQEMNEITLKILQK